jgi:hypothetical protein
MLTSAPPTLFETGLPLDPNTVDYAESFTPAYPLWSDGSDKRRWVYLPRCTQINTSSMNDWQVPPGTRVWKEFSRDGKRIETRLIHKNGAGIGDWLYAAYLWNEEGTEATLVGDDGVADVLGTDHDIPSQQQCNECHGVLSQRVLGLSAIQLSHDGPGLTMKSLSDSGQLSVPEPEGFSIPGDAVAVQALGYLHANCGNCHNSRQSGALDMKLRLRVGQGTVEETDTFATTVGLPTSQFECEACPRIVAGTAPVSAIVLRMSSRDEDVLMPPMGSEVPDSEGLRVVSDWIDSLSPAP